MHPDHPPTTPTTNRVLVVLDPDDPETTLRAVVREADPTTTEFHLLLVYPTAEYEARRAARLDAGITGPYAIDQLAEAARYTARRVGHEYLGPDTVGFEALGAVGRTRDCIERAVRDADYGRVYVAEESRSVWQRLLGVERLSTALARVLPDVVSVVGVDDVLERGVEEPEADVPPDSESARDGSLRPQGQDVT